MSQTVEVQMHFHKVSTWFLRAFFVFLVLFFALGVDKIHYFIISNLLLIAFIYTEYKGIHVSFISVSDLEEQEGDDEQEDINFDDFIK